MSNQQRPQESKSEALIRNAGKINDPDHKLWAPARWVVQLVQYMIAVILITIGEGFKAIVSGKKPARKRRAE